MCVAVGLSKSIIKLSQAIAMLAVVVFSRFAPSALFQLLLAPIGKFDILRTLLLFGSYNCHSYTSDHICSLRWFSSFLNLKLFFGVFSRRVMYVASLQFPTSFNQSELIIHLLQQLYIYFVCKILSKYFFFPPINELS